MTWLLTLEFQDQLLNFHLNQREWLPGVQKLELKFLKKMGKMLEMAKRSHPAGTECDRVGREASRIRDTAQRQDSPRAQALSPASPQLLSDH